MRDPIMGHPGNSHEAFSVKLEARMLSGEPFTYGGLGQWRADLEGGALAIHDYDRLIDRTIQKLRRKGLISFERKGGAVIWKAATQ